MDDFGKIKQNCLINIMKNNFEKLNQQSIAQDEDKKSQESPEKQISIESSVKWREQNIAERTHAEALSGERL